MGRKVRLVVVTEVVEVGLLSSDRIWQREQQVFDAEDVDTAHRVSGQIERSRRRAIEIKEELDAESEAERSSRAGVAQHPSPAAPVGDR